MRENYVLDALFHMKVGSKFIFKCMYEAADLAKSSI
jgi:hypothetical protein